MDQELIGKEFQVQHWFRLSLEKCPQPITGHRCKVLAVELNHVLVEWLGLTEPQRHWLPKAAFRHSIAIALEGEGSMDYGP